MLPALRLLVPSCSALPRYQPTPSCIKSSSHAGECQLQGDAPVRTSSGQLQSLMAQQRRLAGALKLVVLQACSGVRMRLWICPALLATVCHSAPGKSLQNCRGHKALLRHNIA